LGLALDEPKKDEIKTINEIDIMVEDKILNYIGDTKIDYIMNEHGEGFAIIPAHGSSCC
jgi:Fe-S cluster assembly iron-binding protein IscA